MMKKQSFKTQYPDNSSIIKEYDALGFLKKETDCNGTITNFSYNPKGQLTQMDFHVNGGTLPTPPLTYGYDSFGRINSVSSGTHTISKSLTASTDLLKKNKGLKPSGKYLMTLTTALL